MLAVEALRAREIPETYQINVRRRPTEWMWALQAAISLATSY